MKKTIDWFMNRIGTTIVATSPRAFNGPLMVQTEDHANHLCFDCQDFQGYTFEDVKTEALEVSSAMLYELKKFEDLLLQAQERPGFTMLLTLGEQCSVNEMLKTTKQRISILQQFQQTFL
jgi:hypothetical protein